MQNFGNMAILFLLTLQSYINRRNPLKSGFHALLDLKCIIGSMEKGKPPGVIARPFMTRQHSTKWDNPKPKKTGK